jgi:tetratricopeptide (TPR) repeat protein
MNDRTKTLSLACVVVIGMIAAVMLSRFIDARRPAVDANATADESLYLNAKTAKRISLGFNGLAADWYWMRSLQYVGRKIMNFDENIPLDDLNQLNLKLLAPLLENATTLDPEFLDPYEYAAVVLPAIDVQEAIRLTRKGIDANPNSWRLHQHLAYIYWQQHDYATAAETYGRGAQLPGAPYWMEAMKARMTAEGGSRATAREIYKRMIEQSTDEKVKDMARKRLMQLDSFDQRDLLRKLFAGYQARTSRCPDDWQEMGAMLRAVRAPLNASGAPLDPAGAPYVLQPGKCEVELSKESEIPFK